jgi:3-hydroxyacyl-CoA dehydrogenase/enoyl-CoA hydratase/3-hydroxybutyryl-CoA epimerase
MEKNMFTWQQSAEGIVTLTLDAPDAPVNTMTADFPATLESVVDRLVAERDGGTLRGVILTSAKQTFFAGADLRHFIGYGPDDAAAVAAFAGTVTGSLRRIETLGVPVVAALNGSALGGGLELALACHHRIALDTTSARFGLPEATLGLLPGGGGVVRSVRLLGLTAALDSLLLSGAALTAAKALDLGIVDELVTDAADLLPQALAWIESHPESQAGWDHPGWQQPGERISGIDAPAYLPALTAGLRQKTGGAPAPAQRNILCAAVEGSQVDFDTASRIETRYFVELVTGQIAKNVIQSQFFDTKAVRKGVARPAGFATFTASRIGVVGAGMMGAGIAYSAAAAGVDVVLKDVSVEAAERGKAAVAGKARRAVKRGRLTEAAADALVARVQPVDDANAFADADVVIEAVFEDASLKADVLTELDKVANPSALLASNTSTLPISGLAGHVSRPAEFVGLHFFSPVEAMDLVEVIVGNQTSDAALAKAMDIAKQLGKMPIVVNDGRGFFTSRVILQRLLEACAMVAEGVTPITIERASTQAGYPLGTLALLDEVTLSLPISIRAGFREAAVAEARAFRDHPGEPVLDRLATQLGRRGRIAGAGFYDYAEGRRLKLAADVLAEFGPAEAQPSITDLKDRLLFAEALETARCFDEGVLRSAADANVGSLQGIGFPAWTGGTAQFVNGYPGGIPAFVARARELAALYGERFTPPAFLTTLTDGDRIG